MKKILALIAISMIALSAMVAQTASMPTNEAADSYADTSTQVIKIEDKYADLHPKAKTVTITLEHIPLTGEVHLYYTCLQPSFDEGEAMNTAIAVYEDFMVENKYKHKRYIQKDKTKFYKDGKIKMAQYISYVMMSK